MELDVRDYTSSTNAPDTTTLSSKPIVTVSPSRQRHRERRIKEGLRQLMSLKKRRMLIRHIFIAVFFITLAAPIEILYLVN